MAEFNGLRGVRERAKRQREKISACFVCVSNLVAKERGLRDRARERESSLCVSIQVKHNEVHKRDFTRVKFINPKFYLFKQK